MQNNLLDGFNGLMECKNTDFMQILAKIQEKLTMKRTEKMVVPNIIVYVAMDNDIDSLVCLVNIADL